MHEVQGRHSVSTASIAAPALMSRRPVQVGTTVCRAWKFTVQFVPSRWFTSAKALSRGSSRASDASRHKRRHIITGRRPPTRHLLPASKLTQALKIDYPPAAPP